MLAPSRSRLARLLRLGVVSAAAVAALGAAPVQANGGGGHGPGAV
jgi:hypothetical protein